MGMRLALFRMVETRFWFEGAGVINSSSGVRGGKFGERCIQSHLSLFPITSWGIFNSLSPSANGCHPVGSIPFLCLTTSFTKSMMLDPWIGLPYSLTVPSSSQDMLGLSCKMESKSWALRLNILGTLSTTSWLIFEWLDDVVFAKEGRSLDDCSFNAFSWAVLNLYKVWPYNWDFSASDKSSLAMTEDKSLCRLAVAETFGSGGNLGFWICSSFQRFISSQSLNGTIAILRPSINDVVEVVLNHQELILWLDQVKVSTINRAEHLLFDW